MSLCCFFGAVANGILSKNSIVSLIDVVGKMLKTRGLNADV